jgi:hypothetical protein
MAAFLRDAASFLAGFCRKSAQSHAIVQRIDQTPIF